MILLNKNYTHIVLFLKFNFFYKNTYCKKLSDNLLDLTQVNSIIEYSEITKKELSLLVN